MRAEFFRERDIDGALVGGASLKSADFVNIVRAAAGVIASLFQDERTAGLVWLLIVLGPLLFSQRVLTREIQAVLFLLTRRPRMSLGIFSALFFPGVLLHEASHLVTARLLGVKTGRLSLRQSRFPVGGCAWALSRSPRRIFSGMD